MKTAKIYCVTCGEWFPEDKAGLDNGKIAECENCTNARDAARYRWLRKRDLDAITKGGVFAGQTPQNIVLNGIDLDIEIDKRLAV